MADVFISYRKADRAKAEALAKALRVENLDIWWDAGLETGETFDEKIQAVLQEAKAVIVVWSRESVKSDWVRAESSIGRERGVLVPVMIQSVNIPVPFNLLQTADLIGWTGDRSHPGYRDVVKQVKTLANKTHVQPLRPPPNRALRNVWRAIAAVAVIALIGASTWVLKPWERFSPEARAAAAEREAKARLDAFRGKLAPFGVGLADFDKYYGQEIARRFDRSRYADLKALAAAGEPAALALQCAVDTWDYDGRGKDPELGDAVCSKAAEAGDPIGRVYYGDFLSSTASYDPRIDFEKSQKAAVAEYRKAADAGVPWGQYLYGMVLRQGEAVTADPVTAETYLKSARDKGLPAADYGLALLYLSGEVAGPSPEEAFAMIRKAADAGFDEAQFDLCDRLVGGYNWPEDLDAALRYCRSASQSARPLIAEKSKSFATDVQRRIAERDAAAVQGAPPPPAPN